MSSMNNVLVAGSGTMGMSIAQIFAEKGYKVLVYDVIESAIEKGKKLVSLNQESMIQCGKISKQASDELVGRIA